MPLFALDVQRAGIPGQPGAKVSVTLWLAASPSSRDGTCRCRRC